MNDFDAALASMRQTDAAQRARVGYGVAVQDGASPELEADLQRTARRLGIPAESVRAHPKEAKARALVESTDFSGLAATSPATAALLADFDRARVAHDDVENLGAVERAARGLSERFDAAAAGTPLQALGNVRQALGAAVPSTLAGFAGLAQAAVEAAEYDGPLQRAAAAISAYRQQQAKSSAAISGAIRPLAEPGTTAATVEQGAYSGLTSLGQMVLAAPAWGAGAGVASLAMAGPVAGEAYGKGRDKGLDRVDSAAFGAWQGSVEYLTERVPMGRLIGDLAAHSGALKTILRQVVPEFAGEQIATALQDAGEWAALHPERTLQDYLAERPDAALQTLVATAVGMGGIVTLTKGAEAASDRLTRRAGAAESVQAQTQALTDLVTLAQSSKVRERDAETFEAFMQSATEDGPVTDLYVDPQALQQAKLLDAVAAASPSAAAQIQEALATGRDIRIPVSEFAARIDDAAALLPHLKTSPDGMSQAEADDYLKTHSDRMKAEVDAALTEADGQQAWRDSRDAVEAAMLAQLERAGRFNTDANRPYASLVANWYAVQAARVGVTPEEMADRYPLRIAAQAPTGAALDQSSETSAAVEAWRKSLQSARPGDPRAMARMRTPAVLRDMGVREAEITLPARVAAQIAKDHPDVSAKVVADLPLLMRDPVYVYSHSEGGINVILDAKTEAGASLLVGVREGRIRTITPIEQHGDLSGDERVYRRISAALGSPGKVYARNDEALVRTRASGPEAYGTEPLRPMTRNRATVLRHETLVNRHGDDFYQSRASIESSKRVKALENLLGCLG